MDGAAAPELTPSPPPFSTGTGKRRVSTGLDGSAPPSARHPDLPQPWPPLLVTFAPARRPHRGLGWLPAPRHACCAGAIALVAAGGSLTQTAADLGITHGALSPRITRDRIDWGLSPGRTTSESSEMRRARTSVSRPDPNSQRLGRRRARAHRRRLDTAPLVRVPRRTLAVTAVSLYDAHLSRGSIHFVTPVGAQ